MEDIINMRIEETAEAQAWLSQFEVADREVARQMLRKLVLVSESNFDTGIQHTVEKILKAVGKENVALFPITEPPGKFSNESRRVQGSSADRVKHLIENIARIHGARISANPTLHSMRQQRIKNIVFIDDFVASGTRVQRFWRDFCKQPMGRSVRSWVSFGWTRLWLVSYASLGAGRSVVKRTLPKVTALYALKEPDTKFQLTGPMRSVAGKYGQRFEGDDALGFEDGAANIVFQHGCPNNCPPILWAENRRFKPLFPRRGIPLTLHACFGRRNAYADAETLWDYNQYLLALTLISDIRNNEANMDMWVQVTALALASAYGKWDSERLRGQLNLTTEVITSLLRNSYALNLIDTKTAQLTPFGRDLLDRLRRPQRLRTRRSAANAKLTDLYYPDSCGGVAKH